MLEKGKTQQRKSYDYPLQDSLDWISYGQRYYRGQLKDGVPQGEGEMKCEDGTVYKGYFNNGNMDGFGIMTWPSGKRYEGEWHDGAQSGHGTMSYPNGSVYEGNFLRGMREGHGILRQPNGEYFEGDFINDKISDNGVFVDEKGNNLGVDTLHKRANKTFWGKTKDLWASFAWFGAAILLADCQFGFCLFSAQPFSDFSDVMVLLAIVMSVICGCEQLYEFFSKVILKK